MSPVFASDSGICDIIARKKAETHLAQMEGSHRISEEALRDSEERYQMLLDGVQNYAIFMIDLQRLVISWNAGAEKISGVRISAYLRTPTIALRRPVALSQSMKCCLVRSPRQVLS